MRKGGCLIIEVPEGALPMDHPARLLWRVVGTLDLSTLLARAKAVEGSRGRDTSSVRMLLTLWLYAVSLGIGSAREVARCIESDVAFRWIVGDQRVGRSTLSNFRSSQGLAFDALLTNVLGALMHKQLISLELVAQDGMRVRASASAPSFRRAPSLEECREQAALHLKAVLSEADDPSMSAVAQHAREVAARDYARRVDEAINVVRDLAEQRTRSHKKHVYAADGVSDAKRAPRASTTDPQARVMKMADGGFRPAYNVQLATAGSPLGGARTIVGIRVTNQGTDAGSVAPMLEEIERHTGVLPETLLADGGFNDHESIRAADARGVRALIAVPRAAPGVKSNDDAPIQEWRARMQTDEAKRLYRARASLAELPNAHFRSKFGLTEFLVRGLTKVTGVVLLTALAANLLTHAAALLA